MEKQLLPITPFQRAGTVILLVDEDAPLREMLCMTLAREPSSFVYAAATATDALQFLRFLLPDLLIIDYELSSGTGLHFYDQIQQQNAFPPIPGILLSAPLASCELEPRPLWVVQEPFDPDTLLAAVKQAALCASRQNAEWSRPLLKEGKKTMKTKVTFFCSAVRILSWGFVCGLLIAPVSSLVLRPLLVRLFPDRSKPKRPRAPAPLVRMIRTEHGLIVYATPQRPRGFPVREVLPAGKETRTRVEHQPALAQGR